MHTGKTHPQTKPWSLERRVVAGSAAIVGALVWTHALAAWMRPPGSSDLASEALALTLASVVAGTLAAVLQPSRWAAPAAALGGAGVVLAFGLPGSFTPAIATAGATAAIAALAAWGGRHLGRRLPASLDGSLRRRPVLAVLWACLALLSVVQIGRLTTYMTDPSSDWFLTTRHPFWAQHECLPAYLYAAELHERGEENVYEARHYPGLHRQAEPHTDMTGMTPEDPFQYPPQFLVLPILARALTHDYTAVRVTVFALQTSLFLGVAAWLALWVGGRSGKLAAWLLPLALSSFPTLHALQFGQIHLTAVALSIAALLAFSSRRPALGGGLLAAATLAKVFPGVLLPVLVAQRRWRELAWTTGLGIAFTLVAWVVLGHAPFVAFLDYQVPRLANGQAFAFDQAWPEIRDLLIADNQGIAGLLRKLGALGAPGVEGLASPVTKLFGVGLLCGALALGWRSGGLSRQARATSWLALLGLASMASPGAWGDYVPLTAVWLLTYLVRPMARGPRWAIPLGICWIFHVSLLGTAPIGDWAETSVMIPLSAVAVLAALGLYGGTLLGALGWAPLSHRSALGDRTSETRATVSTTSLG